MRPEFVFLSENSSKHFLSDLNFVTQVNVLLLCSYNFVKILPPKLNA